MSLQLVMLIPGIKSGKPKEVKTKKATVLTGDQECESTPEKGVQIDNECSECFRSFQDSKSNRSLQ